MPIITGSTTTSFSKFSIENLSISNLNAFSSLDFFYLLLFNKAIIHSVIEKGQIFVNIFLQIFGLVRLNKYTSAGETAIKKT